MVSKSLTKLLQKEPTSLSDLCKEMKTSKSQVKSYIHNLRKKGVCIQKNTEGLDTTYFLPKTLPKEPIYDKHIDNFALIGDTHLGSKYAEPEALDMFYDEIDEAGIKHVFHAGDLVEGIGVYQGQYNDLLPQAMNIEGQIDLAVKDYPQKKDLETLIICLSSDTEVFVNNQWVTYDKIKVGDTVLSIDPKTKELIENKINAIQVLKHRGKLIRFKNSNIDSLISPNHAVLSRVATSNYSYTYKKAKNIKTGRAIPASGLLNRKDYPISDEKIRLLGWIVTEGSYLNSRGIQIYQSESLNLEKCKSIEKDLNKEKVKFGKYKGKGDGNIVYYLPKKYSDELKKYLLHKLDISILLKILSKRQLKELLKTLIEGDGIKKTETSWTFYSTLSKQLCEQVQLLCILVGYRATLRERERKSFGYTFIEYSVQINKRADIIIQKEDISEIKYEGIIFDLTTEIGNFLCRRKGSSFFTGNSGNHDLRQFSKQGIDPVREVTKRRKDITFLGQNYGRVKLKDDILMEIVHPSGGAPYCYDDKTEILTEDGWKLFKDLNKKEKVATFNLKTQTLEWKKPVDYIEQEYNGTMISIQTRFVDLVTTPNHKLLVRNSKSYMGKANSRKTLSNDWRLLEASKLKEEYSKQKWQMLRTSPTWKGIEKPINRDWINFLAWYITEGFSRERRVVICQNKQDNMKEIQKIVENLGYKYSMYRDNSRLVIFSKELTEKVKKLCGSKSYEKHIPLIIKRLNKEQLKEFIVTLCKGDGWFNKNNQPVGFTSVSKQLIDDLTEILLEVGWYGKVAKRIINTKFGVFEGYTCTITQKQIAPQINYKPKEINYKGKIYCVEVPNNIIFVRRNNKAIWSGNTKGYRFRTYLRERPIKTYPEILAMGHLHCSMFEDVQGTLSYMVGAFMGDTDYTRRKGLVTTIGGWNVDLDIDGGEIKKVRNEFIRF